MMHYRNETPAALRFLALRAGFAFGENIFAKKKAVI